MTTMTVMPIGAAEWTVDDLDQLPDDGLRYELLDGILLVSPAPTRRHQRAVLQLGLVLQAACPPELEVLVAPLDWRPDRKTSLQPDVLVLGNRDLTSPAAESMILAVEVLSPSSRRKDAIYKHSKYEDEVSPATGSSTRRRRRSLPWTWLTADMRSSARLSATRRSLLTSHSP